MGTFEFEGVSEYDPEAVDDTKPEESIPSNETLIPAKHVPDLIREQGFATFFKLKYVYICPLLSTLNSRGYSNLTNF